MFVKPALGRKVRWPQSMRLLSDQGEDVPNDFYWQRLVQTGDVIVIDSTITEPKKSSIPVMKKEDKDG